MGRRRMGHTLKSHNNTLHQEGFTLVELAIVLVIVGLIIGGILVGQDLIKAAEIRSTTASFEKFNVAAITFRNKYSGLPGDLHAPRAAQYGLAARSGAAAHGDHNGMMEGCTTNSVYLGCETGLFWVDLASAYLIGERSFTSATDSLVLTATTIAAMQDYLPTARLRNNAFISVYTEGGRNYYLLGSFSDITNGVQTFSAASAQAVSAAEAEQLDEKIDDGRPLSGSVRAVADWNAGGVSGADFDEGAAPGTGVCVDEGAAASVDGDEIYNTSDQGLAVELNCALSIRASF